MSLDKFGVDREELVNQSLSRAVDLTEQALLVLKRASNTNDCQSCLDCDEKYDGVSDFLRSMLIPLCVVCNSKGCPKSYNHSYPCSGSSDEQVNNILWKVIYTEFSAAEKAAWDSKVAAREAALQSSGFMKQ